VLPPQNAGRHKMTVRIFMLFTPEAHRTFTQKRDTTDRLKGLQNWRKSLPTLQGHFEKMGKWVQGEILPSEQVC